MAPHQLLRSPPLVSSMLCDLTYSNSFLQRVSPYCLVSDMDVKA